MTGRQTIVTAILGGLVLAGSARADMVPASQLACAYRQFPSTGDPDVFSPTDRSSPFLDYTDARSLESAPFDFWPRTQADPVPTAQAPPVQTLADGQDSFSLCLCALLGLGLWKSAPLLRKSSFDCIPSWYHDHGPSQIGHSLAISSDCLCSAAVCFVQPDDAAVDHIPPYRFGSVISRWRTSQFTSAVLGPRAPLTLP